MPSALSFVNANAVCAIADAASISIMPFASVTVLAAFAKICCGVIVSLFSSGRIIISSSSSESFPAASGRYKTGRGSGVTLPYQCSQYASRSIFLGSISHSGFDRTIPRLLLL